VSGNLGASLAADACICDVIRAGEQARRLIQIPVSENNITRLARVVGDAIAVGNDDAVLARTRVRKVARSLDAL
jgi:hypothetical protein